MKIRGFAVAMVVVSALASSAVAAQEGYDKKTIEKMLSDGAKKLASANAADHESGAGYILGYITCAYRLQYMPVMIKALKDPNPKVRSMTAQSLEKIQGKEAISDLVLLLDDPDDSVRERAAYALGDIGDKSAVPGITKAKATATGQKKTMIALTMQEALDEISGKSKTEHPTCP